MSHARRLL